MFEITNYLFVDTHGTEYISDRTPFRIEDDIRDHVPRWYREKNPPGKGYNTWATDKRDTDDYGYYGIEYDLEAVELPRGTIEKFIGKSLKYEDDPVFIDFTKWEKKC